MAAFSRSTPRIISSRQATSEPTCEPIGGQARDLLQRARLFKEVRRSGNDLQLRFRAKQWQRRAVHGDNRDIVPADDEQRGSLQMEQGCRCQIGPSTVRNDGTHALRSFSRRY
jgi:hypothetical protein